MPRTPSDSQSVFKSTDLFARRHIGPGSKEINDMLRTLGFSSLEELTKAAVPSAIRTQKPLAIREGLSEYEALTDLRQLALKNQIFKSFIGMGYHDCVTPPVIQRNILENPGWYTQYTPYQAEISQGRLEALLNFQTMIADLTGLPIANASLLDEATAAAEAMHMCLALQKDESERAFFVSEACHPQVIEVVKTRARALDIPIIVGNHHRFDFKRGIFGALVSYPATDGAIYDYKEFADAVHGAGALFVVTADLMALTLLRPPGEFGADVVVGSAQRFGVPLGYGGPHAAFLSTKDEYKRQIPGRLVGVSVDADGKPALRLALQTREQHIRRAKATSNICTAQVLLAVVASMYGVYHGPRGLKAIAGRIHNLTALLAKGLAKLGYDLGEELYFDTLCVRAGDLAQKIHHEALRAKFNLRLMDGDCIGVSLGETVNSVDVEELLRIFARARGAERSSGFDMRALAEEKGGGFGADLVRKSSFMTHPVFNSYHSETEMQRYMQRLQAKDLSLTTSMIPLGSCTMKLNATAEMLPITWPEFGQIHPFAPREQAQGYKQLIERLQEMLADITGFAAVSLQPNAGSQGEYAGLLVIRRYHESRGQEHRNICLIPTSAHGTNPASAVMAGMEVVAVECDSSGNISLNDLREKAAKYSDRLAALMITYPSTFGVFEEGVVEICEVVHQFGGQVYMDGANMNAQVGLARPAEYGADVCHLNLHKTFCIPHGGGGPGMGPIGVGAHLVSFLPSHPVVEGVGGTDAIGPVSAAPWGSASILPISYAYIAMMGAQGLVEASQVAILNANYVARRLSEHYPVLYRGREGLVAHECIIDLRPLKASSGIEVVDVAKRLMDYGFHAPTISFPVPGTMMIEPTESEGRAELDRFCDAMISIRAEIREVEAGRAPRDNNLLKNAPHTALAVVSGSWDRPYSREAAAFPPAAAWLRAHKYWPPVSRIDDPYGDRNLVCSCPVVTEHPSH